MINTKVRIGVTGGRGCNQFELFLKYPLTLKYYLQGRFLYIKNYP